MDVGIGNLTEVLVACLCLVNSNTEIDLADICRNKAQIHLEHLIIAVAGAGSIIAGMLYGTGAVLCVAVEDKISIGRNLAVIATEECRCVQIEIGTAVIFVGVPAKTYDELGQTRITLSEIDLLTLGKIYWHNNYLLKVNL